MLQLVHITVRVFDQSRPKSQGGQRPSFSEVAYKSLNEALSGLTRVAGTKDWRTVSVDTTRAGNFMTLSAVLECHTDKILSPSYFEINI